MKSTITSLHTTAMATANSNPTNNLTNLAISPPPSSSLNFYKYFNAYYAQQHASDLAQQNLLRQQQLDAIRLIQISLDKLTQQQQQQHQQQSFTNSSSSNTTSVTAKSASAAATTAAASTAYREANLHRNLLVSKVLNKAKLVYCQSVMQNMRFSLISKLNYYSSLIQQLSSGEGGGNNGTADEMKCIMQQILHETYQFNLANPHDQLDLRSELPLFLAASTTKTTTTTSAAAVDANNNDSVMTDHNQLAKKRALDPDKKRRSKQRDENAKRLIGGGDSGNRQSIKRVKKTVFTQTIVNSSATKPKAITTTTTTSNNPTWIGINSVILTEHTNQQSSALSSSSSSSTNETIMQVSSVSSSSKPFFRIKKKSNNASNALVAGSMQLNAAEKAKASATKTLRNIAVTV